MVASARAGSPVLCLVSVLPPKHLASGGGVVTPTQWGRVAAHGPWRQRPGLDSDSATYSLCSHEYVFLILLGFVLCNMEIITALVSLSFGGE